MGVTIATSVGNEVLSVCNDGLSVLLRNTLKHSNLSAGSLVV